MSHMWPLLCGKVGLGCVCVLPPPPPKHLTPPENPWLPCPNSSNRSAAAAKPLHTVEEGEGRVL